MVWLIQFQDGKRWITQRKVNTKISAGKHLLKEITVFEKRRIKVFNTKKDKKELLDQGWRIIKK